MIFMYPFEALLKYIQDGLIHCMACFHQNITQNQSELIRNRNWADCIQIAIEKWLIPNEWHFPFI